MTTDLPTRNRAAATRLRPYWGEVGIEPVRCLRDSADEIEQLQRENQNLTGLRDYWRARAEAAETAGGRES